MKTILFALVGMVVVGCGTNGPDYIAGFDPPAPMDGYTRYVTPTVTDITPGANIEMCQWVAAPSESAQDVLAFMGMQSATGHHTVLYATTETNFKVGESHVCTIQDMLSISFVGAIAGAQPTLTDATVLPEGLYFRLPPGQALMANTHWLNATDKTVEGQAVLDVKFAPADDSRTIANLFANNGDTFTIPASSPMTYDVSCVLQQDLSFAMVTNHMHTDGTSAYSELIHPDGTTTMLAVDTTWESDEQFNPKYTMFSVAQPLVAHAGDTYHSHCEWQNQTDQPLSFPDEMCTGVGFYFPGPQQLVCDDGSWGAGSITD
ncbi:MAG TPA: hypothetical protein VGG74_17365 [Kofleriaceae bacterium]|jgi:hypothetical protein